MPGEEKKEKVHALLVELILEETNNYTDDQSPSQFLTAYSGQTLASFIANYT